MAASTAHSARPSTRLRTIAIGWMSEWGFAHLLVARGDAELVVVVDPWRLEACVRVEFMSAPVRGSGRVPFGLGAAWLGARRSMVPGVACQA